MKRTLLFSCVALSAIAVAAIQGSKFSDPEGDLVVTNIRSWKIVRLGEKKFLVTGSGNPMRAVSKSKGTKLEGDIFKVSLNQVGKKYVPTDAHMKGNGLYSGDGELETITAKGETLDVTFTSSSYDAVATGHVSYVTKDKKTLAVTDVTGAKMTARGAYPPTRTGNSGEISGGVTIKYRVPGPDPVAMDATCDRVTLEGKFIHLIGNVKLNGTGGALIGKVDADEATIEIDASGKPLSVEVNGNPGTATIDKGGKRK